MPMLPMLIEPEQLQENLQNSKLLIVDLCTEQNYAEGHIPNALHVPPAWLLCGQQPYPGKLPSLEQLEELFSEIGLSPDTHVVAYDDEGGGWAGRLIWTLDVIGHSNSSYLNGGIHAWRSAGMTQSTTAETRQPTQQNITINSDYIAEIKDILPRLGQKDMAIWDARSPLEYSGEKVLAAKGGHIPGAINCEWTSLMDSKRDLRIREDAEQRLHALGFTKDQDIITHCQTHHRSGFTYLVGKLLGFKMKGYHGSWSEWGNDPNTPTET